MVGAVGGKPRPSKRRRDRVDARDLVRAANVYQAAYERQLSSYARTRLPAPLRAMTAAVAAGSALAAAGASPKQYRQHWKAAARMLATRLKFQAKRTGYVSLGFHDWDILAVAYLARSVSKIVEVYDANAKLSAEQIGVPRARFFERALVAVLSGDGLEVSDAEAEALTHDTAHIYWVRLLEAASARDARDLRDILVEYLRAVHAPFDDERRHTDDPRRPYPGPLSVIGCALCAVVGKVPRLPEDVSHYVEPAVVRSALGARRM